MTTRVVEQIDEWPSESFRGGYAALQELADDEFSGVVRSGTATLCFLNGTVVGVLGGDIEDFEDGQGTVSEAPSPALPLLALMQERNDEVRAKYYTEETPISDVDSTLSSGGFSGYVELSENVLSGDYYVVYHAGRSMSVAYVGNSGQLLTDDEAFERADGEVGIYEVRPSDVDPVEIPGSDTGSGPASVPASGSSGDHQSGAEEPMTGTERETAGTGATREAAATTDRTESTPSEATDGAGSTAAETTDATDSSEWGSLPDDGNRTGGDAGTDDTVGSDAPQSDPTTASRSGATGTGGDRGESTEASRTSTDPPEPRRSRDERASGRARDDAGDRRERDAGHEHSETGGTARSSGSNVRSERAESSTTAASGSNSGAGGEHAGGVSTPGALERRSIPSLDPDRTSGDTTSDAGAVAEKVQSPGTDSAGAAGDTAAVERDPGDEHDDGETAEDRRSPGHDSREATADHLSAEADREDTGEPGSHTGGESRATQLRTELEETEAELDRLAAELADVEAERDRLAEERDDLREEVADLESELDRVRSQLEQLEDEYGASTDAERRLSPAEALEATNLFVRYESKGEATLEAAHDGNASREAVSENLGLEYHTGFEAESATVAGKPYEEFLEGTIQHRFVSWVVDDLLYEIRDTGKVKALEELYDAIPRIDRVELGGIVTAEYVEDGQEHRTQETFDVVVRDRMGNALMVANINDSREAATEDMMSSLVTAASHVGESNDSLAAAYLVTSSFFEPEALETASDATSGGLLSRDKRESFVKLSRKRGYHLCLAEARDGKFHLAVPEL
ncbi:hypothetical protein BRC64_04475 [Halobacteriales archaeon QH_10_67_22]|nr:MAG: hypothetical protein BRC64_04475 [Halobacteriales archaeon QH_10_67_22]